MAGTSRPKCSLCGLEDGACICRHLPPPRKRTFMERIREGERQRELFWNRQRRRAEGTRGSYLSAQRHNMQVRVRASMLENARRLRFEEAAINGDTRRRRNLKCIEHGLAYGASLRTMASNVKAARTLAREWHAKGIGRLPVDEQQRTYH